MLNTFLIRQKSTGKIQSLDDLVLHQNSHFSKYYRVRDSHIIAETLSNIHEAVREVSPGYRQELQRLDDEIEALTTRREDMLGAAFEDGLQLSVDGLSDFVAGDDDDDEAID